MTSKSFDGGRPLNASTSNRLRTFSNGFEELHTGRTNAVEATKNQEGADLPCEKAEVGASDGADDTVSGLLYDMLQKEVVALRKSSDEKDQSLKDKDDALEVCNSVTCELCDIDKRQLKQSILGTLTPFL
jgi:NH3-dependent NAD+ synthetase